MLGRLLPAADQQRENPFNVRGAPIKLYFLSTVLEIEQSEAFKSAIEAAARRKAGAQEALQTKRRKLASMIAAEPAPELPELSRGELSRRAFASIAVDYLLAELQPYRFALMEKSRRGDMAEREKAITEKLLAAVASAHPWLKTETARRKK